MANRNAIIKVMGRITRENLDMDHWAHAEMDAVSDVPSDEGCGTTLCLAGHTVVAAGHKLKWERKSHKGVLDWYAMSTQDGEIIEDLAADLLGLTGSEATELFYSEAETVDELWERVTEVTGVERPSTVSPAA